MATPAALDLELTGIATDVSPNMRALFGPYLGLTGATRLNLTDCGRQEVGFTPTAWPPLPWTGVDCVLAAHVLHLVSDLTGLMRELHRMLTLGGHLIIVSPYASSDDAWADPRTVRALTEQTWAHFSRLGFTGAHLNLVPYPDLQLGSDGIVGCRAELEVKRRFMRNVIKEMHVVLRKVEG